MTIHTDPNTQPDETVTADAVEVQGEAAAPAVDADMAAFDAGLAEANGEAQADDDAPADEPTPPEAKADDTPADPPPAKPSDAFGELPKDAKAETRERFGKLKEQYDTLHQEVEPLRAAAARAQEWEQLVMSTGAPPELMGSMFDYAAIATKANAGDPQAIALALDTARKEYEHWAKLAGADVPGVDPLADYPELRAQVEEGDMTRAAALEVVKARNLLSRQQQVQQQSAQQQQAEARQAEAVNAAKTELAELNAKLSAEDPHFAQRVAKIDFAAIRQHPPHLWAAKVEAAYWRVPVEAPRPRVAHSPLRPGTTAPVRPQPKDDMDAFAMGVASVR